MSTSSIRGASSGYPFAGTLARSLSRLRDLHPDMTVLQVEVFLLVAERPGIAQRDLYRLLRTTDSAASRIVALLSDIGNRGTKGLDLIEMKTNPMDRRERLIHLTPRGVRLVEDILRDIKH